MNHARCILVCGLLALAGCGGGDVSPSTPTTPAPNVVSVGGTYAVAVALGTNSCGPVTVQAQPTSVAHTAGATAFALTHGSNTWNGTLASGGAFTTTPLTLNDAGSTLTVALRGRFTTTGLTATVTVDMQRPAPAGACQYVVDWAGTKQGTPNLIP